MNPIFKGNEIEVLGASLVKKEQPETLVEAKPTSRLHPWMAAAIAIAIIIILTIVLVALFGRKNDNSNGLPLEESEISEIMPAQQTRVNPEAMPSTNPSLSSDAEAAAAKSKIIPVYDSINDVPFAFYPIDAFKAEVTFNRPDSADQNIMLAVTAADVRADNGEIAGEFIIDKKQLTRGSRKPGWCYISPAGQITIGIGAAQEAKKQALADGGCFFRQLALVMDGEVMPNQLKGKSKRRALAFINGKPAIVKSAERESIYDFSQALADYGFSHAIYLPGGEGFWKARTSEGDEFVNAHIFDYEYANFLIIKDQ